MQILKIEDKIRETYNITTLRFNHVINAKPGQFVMVWIPSFSEKPFSLSYMPQTGITIDAVGPFSNKLSTLEIGDKIGIRGPYGNSFELKGKKILVIGGGIGMVPLVPLIEENKENKFTTLIGARTRQDLIFISRIKENSEVIITTQDGSAGIKGYVTDPIDDLLKKEDYDEIVTCGPEAMMMKVLDIANTHEIPTQLSLERYMKCGLGICGSCSIGSLRVCRDGPVFWADELKNTEFGRFKRNIGGRKNEIS